MPQLTPDQIRKLRANIETQRELDYEQFYGHEKNERQKGFGKTIGSFVVDRLVDLTSGFDHQRRGAAYAGIEDNLVRLAHSAPTERQTAVSITGTQYEIAQGHNESVGLSFEGDGQAGITRLAHPNDIRPNQAALRGDEVSIDSLSDTSTATLNRLHSDLHVAARTDRHAV